MRSSLFATVACAALAFAAPASAREFSALYVFGDSLVDAGNAQAAALAARAPDPAPASAGYFEGRFSNGLNWADWLSVRLFGAPTTAALRGGMNFGFGGARASTNGDPIPDLQAQIGLYALAAGGSADPNALYFLNAGGNDAFARTFGQLDAPSAEAVGQAYADAVTQLVGLGARYILLSNVPDIGSSPIVRSVGLSGPATAQSRLLNQAAARALGSLTLPSDVTLYLFNSFRLGQEIAADPAAFGLPGLNLTTPCTLTGLAPECPNLGYFDFVHPTAVVNRLFGDALAATVPAPAALALFGLGAVFALGRRRAAAS